MPPSSQEMHSLCHGRSNVWGITPTGLNRKVIEWQLPNVEAREGEGGKCFVNSIVKKTCDPVKHNL